MNDAMIQIAGTFVFFLSMLGFVYFMKSRSVAKANASVETTEEATPAAKTKLLTKIRSSWQAKDLEQKRWFLYTWLMVLAILVVYAVPHIAKDYTEKRFLIGGIVVLLGLHLVIWPFFTEKTSKSTKIVATAVFLFLIAAVLAPNAAVRAMKIADDKVANFDQNAFRSESGVATTTAPQPDGTPIAVEVPTDSFVVITAPAGYRLSSMECPAENVIEIVDPATKKITFVFNQRLKEWEPQIHCDDLYDIPESAIRNKEFVIFQKPGGSEPSHVTTWWKKA